MAPSQRARQVMSAARTDPAAAHRLAGWYRGGDEGLLQSPQLAFRWNLQAAERGHGEAMFETASAYQAGDGVEVDRAAAMMWIEKAADRGDRVAQYNLGTALEHGIGTPQNYELAATWYQRAADQHYSSAMANLGTLYDAGTGVKQDPARANALYRQAIEVDNNRFALFNLGNSYCLGRVVEKNLVTALSFYQRAADPGHAGGEYRIGWAYMHGEGGYEKNNGLARKYIKVWRYRMTRVDPVFTAFDFSD